MARFRIFVLGTFSAGLLSSGVLVAAGLAGGQTAKLPDLYPLLPEIHSNKNSRWIDTLEVPGKVLYRFDTVIMNRSGAGALDVYRTGENSDLTQVLWKNANHAPPGAVTKDTPLPTAGDDVDLRQIPGQRITYSSLAGHNHFHAPLVAKYSLLKLDGTLVSNAAKNSAGFCLYDSWGNGNFSSGTLCRPGEWAYKGRVRMGISPGVGDFYGSQLADQWVDVTGAVPGDYLVRAEVDPASLYEGESTRGDNAMTVRVTIPGTLVDRPAAVTTPAGTSVQVGLTGRVVGATVKSRKNGTCATYDEDCMVTASPDVLRYRLDTPPGGAGTATVTAGGVATFTPATGFTGPATFTVRASDDRGLSGPAQTVTVNVSGAPGVSVSIDPQATSVETGEHRQFTATVHNGSGDVRWAVNGIDGGNATVGTINDAGLYVAPASIPAGGTATVSATHVGSGISARAEVTVTQAPPVDPGVIIALTPSTTTLAPGATQTFVATMAGASGPLTWSVNGITDGNATVGRIRQDGLYTAPAAALPAAVTVRATHLASGAYADAFVTVVGPVTPEEPTDPGGENPTDPGGENPPPGGETVPPPAAGTPPPAAPPPPRGTTQGRPAKADVALDPTFHLVPRGKRTYLRVRGTVSRSVAGRKVAIQRVDGTATKTVSRVKVASNGGLSAMVRVHHTHGLTVRAVIGSTRRTRAAATPATTVRVHRMRVVLKPLFSLVSHKGDMYLRVRGTASRGAHGRRVAIQRIGESGNRVIGVVRVTRSGRLAAMVKLPPFDGLSVRAVLPATRTTHRAASTTSAVHLPGGGA